VLEMRRILIVVNGTAGGEHLRELVRERVKDGPCRITLLVPSVSTARHGEPDEGSSVAAAEARMEKAIEGLDHLGVEVKGVIGDENPLRAIGGMLLNGWYDEIVVSMPPAGLSRWLGADLPRRVQRRYGRRVTPIVDEPEPALEQTG
jgi:hypothetical protein